MAIADLAAPSTRSKGPTCSVCLALDTLPDDEAAALRRLLSDRGWRYTELSDALATQGLVLGAHVLARHARGQCQGAEKLR